MFSRRQFASGAIALTALCATTGFALAQECVTDKLPAEMAKPEGFPARAISMTVPYGPAGGSGQVAEAMAKAVTEVTGVGINRDYKPGGSGAVGTAAYMALPADGYNVLEHIDDVASAYALQPDKFPNPAEDLIPLVTAQITFSQIYVRAKDDRFSDWKSFVDYAKKNPGKVTIANVSREGSMERINMKVIADDIGIKLQQVSFDKPAARYAALAGSQVDAMFEQPGDVRQFLDSGDFKPILTVFNERPEAFAEVPSLKDVGVDFEPLLRFRGFYVHKGAPADRVKWLQWAFQKAYCTDSFQEFNKVQFMHLIESFRDTEGSVKLLNDTVKVYRQAYKDMGLAK